MSEEKVDIRAAVQWAALNYRKIVSRNEAGKILFNWDAAETDPPPLGESYVEFAASNPTAFFKDTVPKTIGGDADEESDEVKADRKSIAELKALLRKLQEMVV